MLLKQRNQTHKRQKNEEIIKKIMKGIQRRVTKIIKKYYSYRERLEKLGLTTLLERRMRGDLIKTFKIINGISNYSRYFFNISSWTESLLPRQIIKTKSTNKVDFFAHRVIYFWKKMLNQILKF